MEKTIRNKLNKAIKELEVGLKKLNNPTYDNIDKLMRNIMKKYDLTAKELHYGFKETHNNKTPDDWIKGERKMKTFREFLEEVTIIEMRKEDKVKGRKKTPLYIDKVTKKVEKTPEGLRVKKTTEKRMNPEASVGKFKQNPTNLPSVQGGGHGGAGFGYGPQPHGTGGRLRGVKKKDQPQVSEPKLNKYQRRREVMKAKHYRTGGDILHSSMIGDRAAARMREKAQKSFSTASKDWDKK